jgi:hypothetical protein
MIDYKYPTIASGATPIGSAGHAPDEDLLWEDHQWRARKKILSPLSVASTRKSTRHFTPIGRAYFKKPKIYEVEEWRNRSLKKSKILRGRRLKNLMFEEVEDFKKSKIEEFEVWRSQRLKKRRLKKSKIWCLETQPESATQVESRGLLTWVCPSGIHRLVYRVWPIKEVENYKDSKMTWRWRRKVLICIRLGHL